MINETNILHLDPATLLKLRDTRNAEIAEAFKQTKSIHKTREFFNFIYSRDVVRSAISKAGIYNSCVRDNLMIQRSRNKVKKQTYINRAYSKQFPLEIELQKSIRKLFNKNRIYYKAEFQIPGSQMRADFKGKNWVIETKVNTTSQSMLLGISQCLIYSNKLKKEHKMLVLPDDIKTTEFFKKEYISNNIKIVHFSDLLNWIKDI